MTSRMLPKLPQQAKPDPNHTHRIASAPYNFIPLPEVVVTAVDGAERFPNHDSFVNDGYPHTGYFDVTLTTHSPLYVRCPFPLDNFLRQERAEDQNAPFRQQVKNTPDFFHTGNPKQPVIPGSSLRGMLRALLEIASYGKVQWVSKKQLFFRTVDDTAVGKHYRERMTGNVEAGFLRRRGDAYVIRPCRILRIPRDRLGSVSRLYEGSGPGKTPTWQGRPCQHVAAWVQSTKDSARVDTISFEARAGYQEGRLVITGDVPGKRKEFVFLLPEEGTEEIPVPRDVLERFHDDDQITQWQQRAFPRDRPQPNGRERAGALQKNPAHPGEPVFFLREDGELTFLGRAQMFRLPYRNRPIDLVPHELRRAEDIDYAEALFGYAKGDEVNARQGSKARAYASRVCVGDALLAGRQADVWLSNTPIVPKILATPKPTAFQHYLVQTGDDKNTLKHYGSDTPEETVIRGHKLYWHQGPRSTGDIRETDRQWLGQDGEVRANSTQHTQFKPVKPGVSFTFRIYFENLSKRELGALCWVLHPLGHEKEDYCHSLGMGKPLGMGAVKLNATLFLSNRAARYGSLFDGKAWQTGVAAQGERLSDRATLEKWVQPFEEHVLQALNRSDDLRHLYQLERIGMLLKMLQWPGFPPIMPARPNNRFLDSEKRPNTRYMTIQPNEYRDRPLLPGPSAFGELTGREQPRQAPPTTTAGPAPVTSRVPRVPRAITPSPSVPQSSAEEWRGVTLRYVPNSRALEAQGPEGKATATEKVSEELIATLTQAQQARLTGRGGEGTSKRKARPLEKVDVRVERRGNAWHLVAVTRTPD